MELCGHVNQTVRFSLCVLTTSLEDWLQPQDMKDGLRRNDKFWRVSTFSFILMDFNQDGENFKDFELQRFAKKNVSLANLLSGATAYGAKEHLRLVKKTGLNCI